VIYITGGSRGIGLAMALKAARDGAKIVIAAKTADPHPKVRILKFTVPSIVNFLAEIFHCQNSLPVLFTLMIYRY
jgi:NAD(P)-dependent dehydrogenase (short-subunit alcohol dehydrogenase family)